MTHADALRRIRFWLVLFIIGLVLSGVTAFPLKTELGIQPIAASMHLLPWIERVQQALTVTNGSYPFLAYGTDWLAFAHLMIAIAFIGPYRDPVRNQWVIIFGLIACAAVIPLALVAGQVRGIPFGWRMIDCSFGIFGAIPLLYCKRLIARIE
jgi:hypothetical protein